MRRAKSAGAAYRLWKLQRQGRIDISGLSAIEQRRASAFLARHGEDGADALRRMEDDDIKVLFGKACGGVGTFRRIGSDDCTELSPDEQRAFENAITESDIAEDDIGEYLSTVEEKTSDDIGVDEIRGLIEANGPEAVELTRRLDGEAVDQLLKLDTDTQDLVMGAWRVEREATNGRTGADTMVAHADNVQDLGQELGLPDSDTRKLLRAYGSSPDIDEGPLSDADDLQSTLEDLTQSDVSDVDDAIAAISGTETGYKRIAGEADIANGLRDGNNNIDASDIQMEDDVELGNDELSEAIRESDAFKSGTDIDVNVDGELTVKGKTMDSPAIESKNIGPNLPPQLQESEEIEPLIEKLNTFAASGEDDIVVVMRESYLEELEKKEIDEIEDDVNKAIDRLQSDDVPDEVNIEFISFNDLNDWYVYRSSYGKYSCCRPTIRPHSVIEGSMY